MRTDKNLDRNQSTSREQRDRRATVRTETGTAPEEIFLMTRNENNVWEYIPETSAKELAPPPKLK